MSLLCECFIDSCQQNLIDCDLMQYISFGGLIERQRSEGQPFPPLRTQGTSKEQSDAEDISIHQARLSTQANGGSHLVFTFGADWGPSSLMCCTIADRPADWAAGGDEVCAHLDHSESGQLACNSRMCCAF